MCAALWPGQQSAIMQWESEAPVMMAEAEPAMMAEEEPAMMESEHAPSSLLTAHQKPVMLDCGSEKCSSLQSHAKCSGVARKASESAPP